jgi:hypothetical protein
VILIDYVFPRLRTSLRALERGISSSRDVKEDGDEADCESKCLYGIVRVVRLGDTVMEGEQWLAPARIWS